MIFLTLWRIVLESLQRAHSLLFILKQCEICQPNQVIKRAGCDLSYREGCSLGHWRSWADFVFYQERDPGFLRKGLISIHWESWLSTYTWIKHKLPKWRFDIHPLNSYQKADHWKQLTELYLQKMESLKHLSWSRTWFFFIINSIVGDKETISVTERWELLMPLLLLVLRFCCFVLFCF